MTGQLPGQGKELKMNMVSYQFSQNKSYVDSDATFKKSVQGSFCTQTGPTVNWYCRINNYHVLSCYKFYCSIQTTHATSGHCAGHLSYFVNK